VLRANQDGCRVAFDQNVPLDRVSAQPAVRYAGRTIVVGNELFMIHRLGAREHSEARIGKRTHQLMVVYIIERESDSLYGMLEPAWPPTVESVRISSDTGCKTTYQADFRDPPAFTVLWSLWTSFHDTLRLRFTVS
jgi:hypothetical protein